MSVFIPLCKYIKHNIIKLSLCKIIFITNLILHTYCKCVWFCYRWRLYSGSLFYNFSIIVYRYSFFTGQFSSWFPHKVSLAKRILLNWHASTNQSISICCIFLLFFLLNYIWRRKNKTKLVLFYIYCSIEEYNNK